MAFLKFAILFTISIGILAESNNINDRLDCNLNAKSISEQECKSRGCIWSPLNDDLAPACYLDRQIIGYKSSVKTSLPNGFESTLELKESAKKATPFEQIAKLKLSVTYQSENILRIRITDPAHARYEVPIQKNFNIPKSASKPLEYEVSLTDNFNLKVTRKSNGATLFDTSIGGLVFSDQFIQIATYLGSKDVYGFGESYHLSLKRQLDYTTLPMFTRDFMVGDPNMNYYGHHPFVSVVENDGKAHGIFLLNSNAQSYTLLPAPGLTLRMMGGIVDLFLFVGDNPEEVVQLYTSVIGRPVMIPFFALGFQLSKWGHKNLDAVKKVVKRTLDHNMPYDIQYIDSDYKDQERDFTYSLTNFADLPKYMVEMKTQHDIRWTLIMDAFIQADLKGYYAFDEGYKRDVFIKWPKHLRNSSLIGHMKNTPEDKGFLYGKVWPNGPVAFPDFLKNETRLWWKDMIKHLHKDLKFDALWIDMNEPSNFEDEYKEYKCPVDKYYVSNPAMKFDQPLSTKTLCMNAIQGDNGEYVHYDVHSLHGLGDAIATQAGVHEATGKRGFVVSRSTYPSSGKYGSHWLGDNHSNWEQLRHSIIGILEFSLFGISFTGVDICGFYGVPTPELCRRWFQLGAYYPFSRSHNSKENPDQDPGWWAENGHPEVTAAAVAAYRTRYQLMHYLYTTFYHAHVSGVTVARPLHHEFPQDSAARDIDEQFFLGHSLMVNPFLYENQTFHNAYAPSASEWYKLSADFATKVHPVSGHVHFSDSESHRPLLFRAGSILPVVSEQTLPKQRLSTANLRRVPIELWLLPTSSGSASGDLFFDDGETIDTIESGSHNLYKFKLENCHLTIEATHFGYQAPVGSKDILKVEAIKVALASSKTINSANVQVTLNDNVALKASVEGHILKIDTTGVLDLLKSKSKVTVAFKNKATNECFTH